jgi:hypothetical protein
LIISNNAEPLGTSYSLSSKAGYRWMAGAAICGTGLSIVLLVASIPAARQAHAVPSFAVQTGQPCANCHIGAFGPQLTPAGRDFKLHGYVGSDDKDHGLPLAFETEASFTHTAAPQQWPAPGFRPNDNASVDEVSVFYAGGITKDTGAFMQFSYYGVAQQAQVDNIDIRHVHEGELFGKDLLLGITLNNAPTVQDPWNSTPIWGFPFVRSWLAPTPAAATLVDGLLAQRVVGAGAYVLWDDLLYWEADAYKGLNEAALRAVGQTPFDESDRTAAFMPYARLALIKDWEKQHLEIGAFALSGSVLPGNDQTLGLYTRKTDAAFDATYQYITDPTKVESDRLSAHATFIHETATMDAVEAQALLGAFGEHSLDTLRIDMSYSFRATITPTIQYFRTTGTTDINYWGTPNGSPNSDGMIFEVAYVPWGKPDSPFPNVNLRIAVQYVDYFSYDGTTVNARSNNNLFFYMQTALNF